MLSWEETETGKVIQEQEVQSVERDEGIRGGPIQKRRRIRTEFYHLCEGQPLYASPGFPIARAGNTGKGASGGEGGAAEKAFGRISFPRIGGGTNGVTPNSFLSNNISP